MSFHLVLSPHPDDGPRTMGATMHHLAKRGDRVLMITMMGGNMAGSPPDTPVVREFHGTWNVGDDPVNLRRNEDRAACAVLGAEFAHLDVLDCIYRTVYEGRPSYPTRKTIFDTINAHLAEKGFMMREGTIVDATLIAAPPSTKNKDGQRDPEMHQSKKGNDWHFGMKAHVGVDASLVSCIPSSAQRVTSPTLRKRVLRRTATSRPCLAMQVTKALRSVKRI